MLISNPSDFVRICKLSKIKVHKRKRYIVRTTGEPQEQGRNLRGSMGGGDSPPPNSRFRRAQRKFAGHSVSFDVSEFECCPFWFFFWLSRKKEIPAGHFTKRQGSVPFHPPPQPKGGSFTPAQESLRRISSLAQTQFFPQNAAIQ